MERRIRIVGLCLLAVFALSAAVAASAQASVSFGRCEKAPKIAKKVHGGWKDSTCFLSPASPEEQGLGGKENKYEWKPGPAPSNHYLGKGKTVKFAFGAVEIECKSSTGTGALRGGVGPGTIESQFKFTGCNQPKFKNLTKNNKCNTHGKEQGVIETEKLIGALSEGPGPEKLPIITYEGKEKGGGVEGSPTLPFMKFECGQTEYTVSGEVGGNAIEVTNKMSKKNGVNFDEELGFQNLVVAYIDPNSLEEEEEVPASLTMNQAFKFETSYEIRQL